MSTALAEKSELSGTLEQMLSSAPVLIIEDNPGYRQGVVQGLRESGYTVTEAWNGTDGRTKALTASAIVIDVYLPDMDGRELCRRLRASPETANKIIILMSAFNADRRDVLECVEAGCDLFMSKPFSAAQLGHAIERIRLERSAGPDASGVVGAA